MALLSVSRESLADIAPAIWVEIAVGAKSAGAPGIYLDLP
jgi:hypothetical protein